MEERWHGGRYVVCLHETCLIFCQKEVEFWMHLFSLSWSAVYINIDGLLRDCNFGRGRLVAFSPGAGAGMVVEWVDAKMPSGSEPLLCS